MIRISETFIRCPKLAMEEEGDTGVVEKLLSSATPPKAVRQHLELSVFARSSLDLHFFCSGD